VITKEAALTPRPRRIRQRVQHLPHDLRKILTRRGEPSLPEWWSHAVSVMRMWEDTDAGTAGLRIDVDLSTHHDDRTSRACQLLHPHQPVVSATRSLPDNE
jgi:hypothetical protein